MAPGNGNGVQDLEVRRLLSDKSLLDILQPREVRAVSYNSTVDEVLAMLAEHRFLSAPVLSGDELTGVEERDGHLTPKNALCFVDIWDILCSFLEGATPRSRDRRAPSDA